MLGVLAEKAKKEYNETVKPYADRVAEAARGAARDLGYLGTRAASGAVKAVDNALDFAAGGIYSALGKDDKAKALVDTDLSAPLREKAEGYSAGASLEKAGDVAERIGSAAPSGVLRAFRSPAASAASSVVAGLQGAGKAVNENYKETGALDFTYGSVVGAAEALLGGTITRWLTPYLEGFKDSTSLKDGLVNGLKAVAHGKDDNKEARAYLEEGAKAVAAYPEAAAHKHGVDADEIDVEDVGVALRDNDTFATVAAREAADRMLRQKAPLLGADVVTADLQSGNYTYDDGLVVVKGDEGIRLYDKATGKMTAPLTTIQANAALMRRKNKV